MAFVNSFFLFFFQLYIKGGRGGRGRGVKMICYIQCFCLWCCILISFFLKCSYFQHKCSVQNTSIKRLEVYITQKGTAINNQSTFSLSSSSSIILSLVSFYNLQDLMISWVSLLLQAGQLDCRAP